MARQLQHLGKWLVLFLSFFALCASVAHAGTTTTALTVSPNPVIVTQDTTLTATVTGDNPTGTVTFKTGATVLGTGTLSNGVATAVTSFANYGAANVTAVYGGDTNNSASTSPATSISINRFGSTTALAFSPTPVVLGQSTTLTATVTVTGGSDAGTVTFMDGWNTTLGTVTPVNGVATFATNFTTGGSHMIQALFEGNSLTLPSSATTFVIPKNASTTALSTSANTITSGFPLTLTATVTGTNPTGTIIFKDGGNNLGGSSLAGGVASLSVALAGTGTHSITAVYQGDGNNITSTSAPTDVLAVAWSSLSLSVNPKSAPVGSAVTLSANVGGSNPTGTVTFKDGGTTIGSSTVNGSGIASLITNFSTGGTHNLSAVYSGDSNNSTATASNTAIAQVDTVTDLSFTSPANVGQSVTLTATVTGANPTGSITFRDGSTSIGTAPLTNGVATLNTTFNTISTRSLSAFFAGDNANLASVSSKKSLVVQAVPLATTTSTLTLTPNPASAGQNIAIAVTVTGNSPTGTVTFKDGGMTIGIDSLTNGTATLGTTLSAGTYSLSVVYSGDSNNLSSTSAPVSVAVGAQSGPIQTTLEYDAQGNRTRVINPIGAVTEQSYDALGHPTEIRQPAPYGSGTQGTVGLVFDGLGNLTAVTDPRSLKTTYDINGLGNKAQQSSPDTGTENSVYDEAGNLTQKTDARGVVTQHQYDALNRKTQTTYTKAGSPTETEVWTYGEGANGKGRLTTITDSSGQTKWTYNGYGDVLTRSQRTGALTLVTRYEYNSAGQLTTSTYPSGQQVTKTYDAVGNVQSISRNGVAIFTNITYQPFGSVKGWNWGLNQTYARGFDANGRMTSYSLGNASRTVKWDNASRITQITETNGGVQTLVATAGYDNLDRLTSFNTMTSSYGYQYDLSGNRTRLAISGNSYAYTLAPTSNRLMNTAGPAPAKNYSYDNCGNPLSDSQRAYVWSNSGRLLSVTIGGTTTAYTYNSMAQRVTKVGSTTSIFVHDDDGHILGEYDASGNVIQEHLWLGDTPVAMWAGAAATPTYFVFADQIDTTRAITDATGKILWRWDGEAFGLTQPIEDVDGDGIKLSYPLRNPGHYADQESGLFYNHHRYRVPGGNYLSSDPIGLAGGSLSTYSYVNGNPLGLTDPDGLNPVVGAEAGFAVAGPAGALVGGTIGLGIGLYVGNNMSFPGNEASTSTEAYGGAMFSTGSEGKKSGVGQWNKNPPINPGLYTCRYVMYFPADQCADGKCPPFVTGRGYDVTLPGAMAEARTEAQAKIPEGCGHQHHGQMWCRYGNSKPFMP